MRKVTRHTQQRRNFHFIFLLILFLAPACKLTDRPNGIIMTAYDMPPEALQEIELLNQNAYLSNSTKYHIYSLMTKQCMLAQYQGIPCVYPQINYPPNEKAIK